MKKILIAISIIMLLICAGCVPPLYPIETGEYYAEGEKENKVFVIRPTIPEISRTEDDYNKKITYYNHGYSQMRTGFNDLQEYLNS